MPPTNFPLSLIVKPSTTQTISNIHKLMSVAGKHCPCHAPTPAPHNCSIHSTPTIQADYAFEMATSTVRYGPGVTYEVGQDLKSWGVKKVGVYTDKNIVNLVSGQTVLKSLNDFNVDYVLFDETRVEPTDVSLQTAIKFARDNQVDSFVAVGGGSVIDTCKAANLYLCHPEAEFLDFVNAPIGKGLPIKKSLRPLVAIPTTAGTGSETTGVSIFDYTPKSFKTGIASRVLKPTLGIIDPINTSTMPAEIHVASGLDILCHSLESYTAIPYDKRTPRPRSPIERPAYQGSNPISDIWSLKALDMCVKNLERVYKNPLDDKEAREQMVLAATFAGVGFGNAGVHLCHGMSYPISGLNKKYVHKSYQHLGHALVPHGISVAVSAAAVFKFTAPSCPDRHLEAAKIFGSSIDNAKREDAGLILADGLRKFLSRLDVPNGISGLGFSSSDIDNLVEGTLPQHRVTKLSPEPVDKEILAKLFEDSLKIY